MEYVLVSGFIRCFFLCSSVARRKHWVVFVVCESSVSPRVTLRGELCADRLRVVVFESGSGTELPAYSVPLITCHV